MAGEWVTIEWLCGCLAGRFPVCHEHREPDAWTGDIVAEMTAVEIAHQDEMHGAAEALPARMN